MLSDTDMDELIFIYCYCLWWPIIGLSCTGPM